MTEQPNWQEDVRAFHVAMGAPAPAVPTLLEGERQDLRLRLIEEEWRELADALVADDPVEAIDALCDLLYVTFGCAVEMGVDLAPFFAEVHRSNMAKVGGEMRSDGKILKPAGWTPPDIAGVFSQLYEDGQP